MKNKYTIYNNALLSRCLEVHVGLVVGRLTRDQGVAGSSLAGCTVLCPWARHFILCLVLVQPRKTHNDMAEM